MIRTTQLSKRFARTGAIEGLTLDVPEGSVFALVGPNGAGKSTTIKTLLNIHQPSSGSAEVLGVDSRHLGPAQLAQIGYVSENQRLPDWMTVGDFLAYCKPFYPEWRDNDAAELVRAYELPLKKRLKTLSRGMRIKAALAASLAYRPRLIVLDEPFGGLDVLVREQLIESLAERTPQSTIFLASHDLAEIESFATHLAYLNDGSLQFVEEMNALRARFREVEVTVPSAVQFPHDLPRHWLGVETFAHVVRFTDSQFQGESEIARHFPGANAISSHAMTLRSIVIALAKSARSHS